MVQSESKTIQNISTPDLLMEDLGRLNVKMPVFIV